MRSARSYELLAESQAYQVDPAEALDLALLAASATSVHTANSYQLSASLLHSPLVQRATCPCPWLGVSGKLSGVAAGQ